MPILGVPALAAAGGGGGALVLGGGAAATGTAVVSGTTLATGAAVIGAGLLLSGDTPRPLASAVAGTAGGVAPALTPAQQAERLKKVQEIAKALAAEAAASCATGNCCQRTIVISRSRAPQSAQHIEDAQRAGFPSTLTYDKNPAAAALRRRSSTAGIERISGYEPDEYPPAAFLENAGHASVRNIDWRDNRVAGGIIGANLKGVPPGCRITIVTGP